MTRLPTDGPQGVTLCTLSRHSQALTFDQRMWGKHLLSGGEGDLADEL